MPVVAPGQGEAAEVEVRQHGAQGRALRRTLLRPSRLGRADRPAVGPLHHHHRQPILDEAEQPSIGDPAAQAPHQGTVRDRREVIAQIDVDHLAPSPVPDVPEHPPHGHLGVQSGTEAVLIVQQVRLEDRTDHQHHRHHDRAVTDGGDAQGPASAIALGDPHSQQGLGAVRPVRQLLSEPFQPAVPPLGFDRVERHPVEARRAVVGTTATIGFRQDVRSTDLVPESIEPESRFSLRFRLQRGLERLNGLCRCC